MPKAGAAWLEPNMLPPPEGWAGEAAVKLNAGAPAGAPPVGAPPPNTGVELPDAGLLPPNVDPPPLGADAPPALPNWKGVEAPDAGPAEAPPKLNVPPLPGAAGALPLLPEKGLLKLVLVLPPLPALPLPPAEKLKPKPPEPLLVAGVAPNEVDVPLAAVLPTAPPNRFTEGVLLAPPKVNEAGAEVVLPPVKTFLAGDCSSCFIGLPNMAPPLLAGGDLGAKRGFPAAG